MDTILGACYFLTCAGMGYNLVKIKLQGDFEEQMKNYREYDLSTERIKVGTDKIDPDGDYIVLAKHKGVNSEAVDEKPDEGDDKTEAAETKSASTKPYFVYTVPSLAPYDPSRYSDTLKVPEEFNLRIEEKCQDLPFEVVFDRKSKPLFFDLDEVPED